ncbi:hypothetical protein [uncultured Chitinophaga sp.]|uniref:hypothetical protein n=1 Tax=uncultured Chitinophaga sp. TaxID=339340 RepID=UPI0025E52409|nr:hypothetical protein [uncultured Chitinophaga sp.]
MKKDEVPQDGENMHHGTFKQLFYAVDDSGKYTTATSVGWEPENIAMSQAWEEINEKVEQTRKDVLAGKLSPIAYHMEKSLLTLPQLAAYVNKWQWQVKRHMKPAVFETLSEDLLQRYASTFNISVAQLKQVQ